MPTATGLRISSVNGTAFLDNCPADILAAAGTGAQIKIYDASSRYLQGVIDSVGSSEGLGSELITTWNKYPGLELNTLIVNANGHDIDSAIATAPVTAAISNLYSSAGYLNKTVFDLTLNSGTAPRLYAGDGGEVNGFNYTSPMPTDVTTAYYTSKVNKGLVLIAPAGVTFNASLFCSTKQVTAPSSSGVIIKDLSGNQNFISKDANFTYNAASYPYEIINVATASQSVFLKKIFQKGF